MTNTERTYNNWTTMSEDGFFGEINFAAYQAIKTNYFNYMATYETACPATYTYAITQATMRVSDQVAACTKGAH